jgi:hypothetical protein
MSIDSLEEFERSSSSSIATQPRAINDSFYVSTILPRPEVEIVSSTYRVHRTLIESSVGNFIRFAPLAYVSVTSSTTSSRVNDNSARSMLESAKLAYDKIENKLRDLTDPNESASDFEAGAANSALQVINNLCRYHYAPPAVAKQGNDAIVMLWALGDMTYAITVTDGELGYVVRRNRKAVRLVDSISIDTFRLEDMR